MLQISLSAETLFHIGPFPVTNALLLAVLASLVLIGIAATLRRRITMIPGGLQNVAEFFVEGALGIMDSIIADRKTSEKYFPLIFTIFIFILFSNWLGLMPGVGSFVVNHAGGETVPLLRSPASDLNFTLALALIAITFVNVASSVSIGIVKRLSIFFNFKSPITFFIGILELVSEFAKIVSLSFRLFGNVFAGEVLLAIMAFLVPYAVPLPFIFLEIFVGFIQAFIFAMLTTVFIGMSLAEHDEHEENSKSGAQKEESVLT
jgi:F-type H+-transporting ATPase subunit a